MEEQVPVLVLIYDLPCRWRRRDPALPCEAEVLRQCEGGDRRRHHPLFSAVGGAHGKRTAHSLRSPFHAAAVRGGSRRLASDASAAREPSAELVDVPLAQAGEGIAECELLRWFISEGTTRRLHRHPRLRFGKVHLYNNYTRDWGTYNVCVSVKAEIVSQCNIYEGGQKTLFKYMPEKAADSEETVAGWIRSEGDALLHGALCAW